MQENLSYKLESGADNSITKENTIFVAPDAGAAKRTRFLAERFNFPVAIIDNLL